MMRSSWAEATMARSAVVGGDDDARIQRRSVMARLVAVMRSSVEPNSSARRVKVWVCGEDAARRERRAVARARSARCCWPALKLE